MRKIHKQSQNWSGVQYPLKTEYILIIEKTQNCNKSTMSMTDTPKPSKPPASNNKVIKNINEWVFKLKKKKKKNVNFIYLGLSVSFWFLSYLSSGVLLWENTLLAYFNILISRRIQSSRYSYLTKVVLCIKETTHCWFKQILKQIYRANPTP